MPIWMAGLATFVAVFLGATYLLSPDAVGKAALGQAWTKRTTDQHYSGCAAARRNHHENIGAWEPSYRAHMDGDGDGLACEPRY